MNTNREELLAALKTATPGLAAGNEVLDQTSSFTFLDGEVVTYNDEVTIAAPLPEGVEDIEGAVPANELMAVLQKTDAKEIEIELEGDDFVVSAGKYSAGVPFDSDLRLPLEDVNFPDEDEWQELPSDFLDALSLVRFSASSDTSRIALTCVCLAGKYACTTDGLRLTRVEMDSPAFDVPVLLPVFAVSPVMDIAPVKYAVGDNWIHFANEEEVFLSCRIVADQYPGIDKALEMEDPVEISFPKNLSEALDRASVFAQGDFEQDRLVSLSLKKNKATIQAQSVSGWSKETLKIKYNDEPVEFTIHPQLLQDMLMRKEKDIFMDSKKLKFEGNNMEHVVTLV